MCLLAERLRLFLVNLTLVVPVAILDLSEFPWPYAALFLVSGLAPHSGLCWGGGCVCVRPRVCRPSPRLVLLAPHSEFGWFLHPWLGAGR